MKKKYQEIFKLARPYLAVRENQFHTEICYDYAVKLLNFYGGREDIVLPSIILHDIGWSALPGEKICLAFGPKNPDKKLNRVHEVEGAKIAATILRHLSFKNEDCLEICRIIENHDSGENPSNLEERLVKDADKLWRFNPDGFDTDYRRFNIVPQQYWDYLSHNREQWLFTDYARSLAAEGLEKIRLEFLGRNK